MKKIIMTMVFAALLVLSSCSDEKTKPTTSDSQALQNEMDKSMDGLLASPGVNAMNNNMAALFELPFNLPAKSITNSLNGIESSLKSENVNLFKKVFDTSGSTSKQEDHFIFNDWLGTYTYEKYVDEYDGNTYGRYAVDNTNTTNIIVIIPAQYTVENLEFRLILNDYKDQYISWYDEYYEYTDYDYFPTLIDMEVFSALTKVLDLDMTAEWQYISAMEEVIPVLLNLNLGMNPYTMQMTFSNEPAEKLNFSMTLKKNLFTEMTIDATITFTDTTLEEVSVVELGYGFGAYYIDFWSDVIAMDLMIESGYTLDQEVEYLNSGDYIWCYIYQNNVRIGRLMARKVWDEEEWNDETQSYGAYVIVPYIKFNDGSEMGEDQLAALLGGFEDGMK